MQEARYIDTTLTYTVEVDGRFILVENVPARLCVETGEQFFSPAVVERLQKIAWEHPKPTRVIETPVFEFSPAA